MIATPTSYKYVMLFMKNKKVFVSLLLSQLIIFLILYFAGYIKYATNDDTTMVALVSGAYGFANEYVINMNILIGYFLKYLFLFFPVVNWVTVLFCFSIMYSFVLIDYILGAKVADKNRSIKFFYYVVINVGFFYIVTYFTFTVVSYVLAIAAVLCCLKYIESKNKGYFVNMVLTISLSVLIRKDCMQSIFIFLIPLLLYMAIKNKKQWLTIFIAFASCVAIFLILPKVDRIIQNQNTTQKEFIEWGDARSKAMDAPVLDWESNKERFEAAGISHSMYLAAYSAFYFDQEAISKDMFEDIKEISPFFKRYRFDIVGFLYKLQVQLLSWDFLHFITSFSVLILFLSFLQRNKKILNLIIGTSVIVIEFIFFFVQRAPYRVTMPHYVLMCFVLLFCNEYENYSIAIKCKSFYQKINLQRLMVSLVSIFSYIILVNYLGNNAMSTKTQPAYDESNLNVIEYLKENNDKLFLVGLTPLYSLDVARPILEYAGGDGERWNLLGNWEIYSYPYEQLVKSYGINNPKSLLKESIDSDTIQYMTNYGDELPDFVQVLIKERYNIDVDIVEVDQIESSLPEAHVRVWEIKSRK